MAKRASSKEKQAKFDHEDGTVQIDREKLEGLKRKLGKAALGKVRFVALNAPFKRRSAILAG